MLGRPLHLQGKGVCIMKRDFSAARNFEPSGAPVWHLHTAVSVYHITLPMVQLETQIGSPAINSLVVEIWRFQFGQGQQMHEEFLRHFSR